MVQAFIVRPVADPGSRPLGATLRLNPLGKHSSRSTICGILIVLGLLARLATIPLIIIMIVALVSTKLPMLVGHDVWMFHLAQDIKRTGFWSMMHEARADLTMLLGCIYLLIVGAGPWSLDEVLRR